MIEIEETCPGCGSSECKVIVGTHCQSCDMQYYRLFGTADSRDIPNHSEALESIKLRLEHAMLEIRSAIAKRQQSKVDFYPTTLSLSGTIRACLEIIENTKEK